MGKLREQMKGDLELKGLSPHTQEIYLRQVNQFSRHHGRSPRQLGEQEIKEYLLYLIREKKTSASTVNQCYHALKFLYKTTLNREWVIARVPRVKSLKQLPIVLDKEEVESLFSVMKNIKHRAIFCSDPLLRRLSNLPEIQSIWVDKSGLSVSCTLGDRTSWIILISTAS